MSKRTDCVGCDEEVRVGGSVQLSIFLHFDSFSTLTCYESVCLSHFFSPGGCNGRPTRDRMNRLEVGPSSNSLEVNIHSHLVPGKAVIARSCQSFSILPTVLLINRKYFAPPKSTQHCTVRINTSPISNMAAPEEDSNIFNRDDGTLSFEPSHPPASGPLTPRSSSLPVVQDAATTPSHVDPDNTDLPSRLSPKQSSSPPHDTMPRVLDRAFWQRRIRANPSSGLTVSQITDTLGLRRTHRGRGPMTFPGTAAQELADAVAVLASRLPNDAERLVEIALDTGLLRSITDYLVDTYGERVWGDRWTKEAGNLYGVGEEGWYERALRVRDARDREV
jgi:hypothetical protein